MDGTKVNKLWDAGLAALREGDIAEADHDLNTIWRERSNLSDHMIEQMHDKLLDVIDEFEGQANTLVKAVYRGIKVEYDNRFKVEEPEEESPEELSEENQEGS